MACVECCSTAGGGGGNAVVSREPDVFVRWLDCGLSRTYPSHLVR